MDLIRELAELALASRLRRLADRLQADVSSVYAELGLDFEARWFPVLVALQCDGALAVTELAARLGLSHQAVSQTLRLMTERDLVVETVDTGDRRRRRVTLSESGQQLCRRLSEVWGKIREANRDLLAETGIDLLGQLDRIEAALDERSMAARVREQLDLEARDPIQIANYRPAYKKHFRRLNLAWLEDGFEVEPSDQRLLDDPNGRIIRRGGDVIFALVDGAVAGTCALIRHDADTLELAKMAVEPDLRRRGVGRRMTEAAISRARDAGADRLWLRTSPHLRAAGRLYRSLGFRRARRHPFPDDHYQRETFTMVLELSNSKETPR